MKKILQLMNKTNLIRRILYIDYQLAAKGDIAVEKAIERTRDLAWKLSEQFKNVKLAQEIFTEDLLHYDIATPARIPTSWRECRLPCRYQIVLKYDNE